MKKIIFLLLISMFFISNTYALTKGVFLPYSNSICDENNNKYSIDMLQYEGSVYYFLTPKEYKNYNNIANSYHFVNDSITYPEFLKYRYIVNDENINDQQSFTYRFLWEENGYQNLNFCNNDYQMELRYQSFSNKIKSIMNGPNFPESKIKTGEEIVFSYDYLDYFDISYSDGLKVNRKENKLYITAYDSGEYFLSFNIKYDIKEGKIISDDDVNMASITSLDKTYKFKIEVEKSDIEILPPDTLETKGLYYIFLLLLLVIAYVFKKN